MVWIRNLVFLCVFACGCETAQLKSEPLPLEIEQQLLEKKQQFQDLITARNMLLKAVVEQDEILANSLKTLEQSQADILKLSVEKRTNEQASLLPQIEERLRTGKILAQEIAILKLGLQARLAEAQKALEALSSE